MSCFLYIMRCLLSFLFLSAEFYSFLPIISITTESQLSSSVHPLTSLVPRLWKFLRHNITSVRLSVLKTLEKLLTTPGDINLWITPIFADALRNIFQNFISEEHHDIIQQTHVVWNLLMFKCPPAVVRQASLLYLSYWFSMVMGSPAPVSDTQTTTKAAPAPPKAGRGRPKGSVSKAKQKTTDTTTLKRKRGLKSSVSGETAEERGDAKKRKDNPSEENLKASDSPPLPVVPSEDKEAKEASIRMRIAGTKALGALARAWPIEVGCVCCSSCQHWLN